MRRRHLPLLAASALLPWRNSAQAQDLPTRPIRLVVTFPPGGSSDIVGRVLAEALGARLPARPIIDNRPGAGGTLGAGYVATQPPDGTVLLMSNTAPIVTSPPLYPNIPYNPVTGLTHIAYIGAAPLVIITNPRLVPATDLPGLIAWIKAQPAPPGYGSSGAGSIAHIFGEVLQTRIGAPLNHVPYRGSSPMQADLLAGVIPIAFDPLPQNVENIRSGRIRAIALAAPARHAMAPDVATTAEGGYPDLLSENWIGVAGPPGMAPGLVARLHAEIVTAMQTPMMKTRLEELGVATRAMTPAEFTAFVAQEVEVIGGAIRRLGITAG
jgi:tripartite-type tricarboxylate transporter receptor subunit TctC